MKIGEIKIEALMLIFPSLVLEYDEGELNQTLLTLKENGSYEPYLVASVGAINRALTIIEAECGIKATKINHATPGDSELQVDERIAQIIPYFIKSDLLMAESPSEARESRELFYSLLKGAQSDDTTLLSVYSQEELFK